MEKEQTAKAMPRKALIEKGIDWDFWFDRETWSTYMTFLLLTGVLLVVALPYTMSVQQIPETNLKLAELFPTVFVLLFGIISISLGQAEIAWEHRLRKSGQVFHLACRIGLALLLTLPFWVTFLLGTSQPLWLVAPVLVHLMMLGLVLGMLGWRLALTQFSEIFQFNVKYLSFFAFLTVTFLYQPVRFLNPIWPLQEMINSNLALPGAAAFAYYAAWIGIGAIVTYWVFHRLDKETAERTQDGHAIS